jgi:hypothetical protein
VHQPEFSALMGVVNQAALFAARLLFVLSNEQGWRMKVPSFIFDGSCIVIVPTSFGGLIELPNMT